MRLHFQRSWVSAVQLFAWLVCLAFLWWRLIAQLRLEWTVNPQYSYGWAVPFLCLILLWRNAFRPPPPAPPAPPRIPSPPWGEGGRRPDEVCPARVERGQSSAVRPPPSAFSISAFQHFSFQYFAPALGLLLCALLYLPTRLIQEANPDWRFVSWALALEVIIITLCALPMMAAGRGQPADVGGQSSGVRRPPSDFSISAFQRFRFQNFAPALRLPPAAFWFPVCFFLVAVPWPTVIESPLIQALTRFNAATTIELLNAFGIPALQRGNVIEVSTGLVGIDEACSGIRSFQATLMISLFFGAWYRLSLRPRLALVLAGFALAIAFNLGRTLLLVTVAAKQGVPAIAQWHDPAGVIILLGCFGGLWLVAVGLARRQLKRGTTVVGAVADTPGATAQVLPAQGGWWGGRGAVIGLVVWLGLVELGVEFWYRSHETSLGDSVVWQVQPPTAATGFQELPLSEKTVSILRYDAAQNFAWNEPDGTRWQLIYLQWNAGRIAAHLARNHTPEVCLTAAGHQLQDVSELFSISVHHLALPLRRYTFASGGNSLHVFYGLREDRPRGADFRTETLSYQNRFAAVRAGRRNLGQRSIEIAVWGLPDVAQAEAALRQQLEKIITVPPQ